MGIMQTPRTQSRIKPGLLLCNFPSCSSYCSRFWVVNCVQIPISLFSFLHSVSKMPDAHFPRIHLSIGHCNNPCWWCSIERRQHWKSCYLVDDVFNVMRWLTSWLNAWEPIAIFFNVWAFFPLSWKDLPHKYNSFKNTNILVDCRRA